ncbi:MAG TPA: phage head-tail connector protein [Novosphingobium sp.]|nr:phage head-tail connector protein [Novosphingobium sp.]
MSEPVSLDQIKVHLRIDASGTGEDAYLGGLITAARRACEVEINQSVLGGQRKLVLDQFPHARAPALTASERNRAVAIALPGGILANIDVIRWRTLAEGWQEMDSTSWLVSIDEVPGRVSPIDCWPEADGRAGCVVIEYTLAPLGADDLAMVVQAILLTIGHWYENRESVAVDQRGTPMELPQSAAWLLGQATSYGGR